MGEDMDNDKEQLNYNITFHFFSSFPNKQQE